MRWLLWSMSVSFAGLTGCVITAALGAARDEYWVAMAVLILFAILGVVAVVRSTASGWAYHHQHVLAVGRKKEDRWWNT